MLASLLASLASGETVLALKRARRMATIYLMAVISGSIGAGFLLAAAYIWTARQLGSLEAALIFGAVFIVAALIILLVYKLTAGSRARRASRQRKSDLTALATAAGIAALPTLLRRPLGLSTLLVPGLAVIAYAIYRENVSRGDKDDKGPFPDR
ncbi:MAG: hypothetical protein JNK47_04390 [Mesorhizobium sp.]|nr:hypothetical protein [Mesorhizobium sp.]MBL8576442.1 hypothetical protein [Mesorhizobium sp.]